MSEHQIIPWQSPDLTAQFILNGESVSLTLPPAASLLDALRENQGLTAARAGCRIGRCGACTVLLDGKAVPACLVMAWQLPGRHVETLEGLSGDNDFLRVHQALALEGALQCGYCTPGIAISLVAVLRAHPRSTYQQLSEALAGNLCRCTGYGGLMRALDHLAVSGAPDADLLSGESS